MRLFNRLRFSTLKNGNVKRYLVYAIGEIILIVLGILIALNFDAKKESDYKTLREIKVLEGIRDDILRDTVDINLNIRGYESVIKSDSLLLRAFAERKPYEPGISNHIVYLYFRDFLLVLHQSSFEQAKSQGLEIISNQKLRTDVSRLYEFDYHYLLLLENESGTKPKHQQVLDNTLLDQIEFVNQYAKDSTGTMEMLSMVTEETYYELMDDAKFMLMLGMELEMKRELLHSKYRPTLEHALKLVQDIDKELLRLED
ncbi:MAG: hypothetical protein AAGL34_17445 [Bacteroidota bacterium]